MQETKIMADCSKLFSAVAGKAASLRHLLCRGTVCSSIFTLLTTCIGAGTLALPYAIKQGGMIYSSVVFFVIMVVSIVVGVYLIESKRYSKRLFPVVEISGYEDLAEITLGSIGRLFVLVMLVIFLILSLIAYMIYTRDQLDFIIIFILDKVGEYPECSILRNCGVLMVIAFIPLFPITLLRDLTPLQFTSTTSILCIGFLAIVVIIKLGQKGVSQAIDIAFVPSTFEGALQSVTYLSLSFVCQFQLFALEKELHRPTRPRLYLIVIASSLIAYILYNVVALGSYLQFLNTTKTDIMLSFPSNDGLMTAARAALFFALLFSYPVLLHPARSAINQLISFCLELYLKRRKDRGGEGGGNLVNGSDSEHDVLLSDHTDDPPSSSLCAKKQLVPNTLMWFCETWVIFGSTFLIAVFVDNVAYVWNFVGSIGGTLILFILPPVFYLRLRHMVMKEEAVKKGVPVNSLYRNFSIWRDVVAFLILVLGVVLMIVENYVSIYALVNAESHQSLGQCQQLLCNLTGNLSLTD